MKVKFKKLNEKAKVPFKTYTSDFCYDVVATSEKEIAPNVWEYGLGFALQIVKSKPFIGYADCNASQFLSPVELDTSALRLSIDFRPRSSVWKTGMVLCNCTPTIDEGYTGEIKMKFYHVMPNMPRYKVGDKIAQMKLGATFPIQFIEVTELSQTDRGDNGFGSTGQ